LRRQHPPTFFPDAYSSGGPGVGVAFHCVIHPARHGAQRIAVQVGGALKDGKLVTKSQKCVRHRISVRDRNFRWQSFESIWGLREEEKLSYLGTAARTARHAHRNFLRTRVFKQTGRRWQMLKKSLLAVFGLALALAFVTPPKANAGVAIGVTI